MGYADADALADGARVQACGCRNSYLCVCDAVDVRYFRGRLCSPHVNSQSIRLKSERFRIITGGRNDEMPAIALGDALPSPANFELLPAL